MLFRLMVLGRRRRRKGSEKKNRAPTHHIIAVSTQSICLDGSPSNKVLVVCSFYQAESEIWSGYGLVEQYMNFLYFLIARLAQSNPRNHYFQCTSMYHLNNFSVFRHIIISSLDMIKSCINSYQNYWFWTSLDMFENDMNRNNLHHIDSEQV